MHTHAYVGTHLCTDARAPMHICTYVHTHTQACSVPMTELPRTVAGSTLLCTSYMNSFA